MKKSLSVILLLICLSMVLTPSAICSASRPPKLNVKTLSLTKKSSYVLRVYNTTKAYTTRFESDNTAVVAVKKPKAKKCTLKAKSAGTANITVTVTNSDDEIVSTLKCTVTVSPPAVSVKFAKSNLKLEIGETKHVKAVIKPNISSEQPMYTSDNEKIATVSSNGTITALTPGQTTIRATIKNGKEGVYTVIVNEAVANNSKAIATPPTESTETIEETQPTPSPEAAPTMPPKPEYNNERDKNKYQYPYWKNPFFFHSEELAEPINK